MESNGNFTVVVSEEHDVHGALHGLSPSETRRVLSRWKAAYDREACVTSHIEYLQSINRDLVQSLVQRAAPPKPESQISSAKIGQMAEQSVLQRLQTWFPQAEIFETHKEPHSGDFVLKINNSVKILVEVKDVQVLKSEQDVNKFLRDTTTHTDVDAGVLVSCRPGVRCPHRPAGFFLEMHRRLKRGLEKNAQGGGGCGLPIPCAFTTDHHTHPSQLYVVLLALVSMVDFSRSVSASASASSLAHKHRHQELVALIQNQLPSLIESKRSAETTLALVNSSVDAFLRTLQTDLATQHPPENLSVPVGADTLAKGSVSSVEKSLHDMVK
eukprot:2127099-Pyramimonas_sp.AAC.1